MGFGVFDIPKIIDINTCLDLSLVPGTHSPELFHEIKEWGHVNGNRIYTPDTEKQHLNRTATPPYVDHFVYAGTQLLRELCNTLRYGESPSMSFDKRSRWKKDPLYEYIPALRDDFHYQELIFGKIRAQWLFRHVNTLIVMAMWTLLYRTRLRYPGWGGSGVVTRQPVWFCILDVPSG